jgi:hypothetical protein
MAKLWTALEVELEAGDTVPENVLSAALQSGSVQMRRAIEQTLGSGSLPCSTKIIAEQPVFLTPEDKLFCCRRS